MNQIIQDIKYGFLGLPKALRYLLAINIGVFVLGLFNFYPDLLQMFGYRPNIESSLTQPWRIITYTFIHSQSNPFHLLFNMLVLWFFGKPVEESLGTKSFTTLYFMSAVGGALIQMLVAHITGEGLNVPVIGASGAIMGVTVAFGWFLYPNMQVLFLFIPMPAKYLVVLFVLLDVLFIGAGDNVARLVHIGGAATAFAIMHYRMKGYDIVEIFDAIASSVRPKQQPKKHKVNANMHKVQDVEVVDEVAQLEIDRILDKISKHGYEGLTAEEKQTLFDLSKRK